MELIVYSALWCPDCREAKRFLDKYNIAYKEIDVATTPGAAEERSGRLESALSRSSSLTANGSNPTVPQGISL